MKKRFQHRCFPVNFEKFLRTPFFYRTPPAAASATTEDCEQSFVIINRFLALRKVGNFINTLFDPRKDT